MNHLLSCLMRSTAVTLALVTSAVGVSAKDYQSYSQEYKNKSKSEVGKHSINNERYKFSKAKHGFYQKKSNYRPYVRGWKPKHGWEKQKVSRHHGWKGHSGWKKSKMVGPVKIWHPHKGFKVVVKKVVLKKGKLFIVKRVVFKKVHYKGGRPPWVPPKHKHPPASRC